MANPSQSVVDSLIVFYTRGKLSTWYSRRTSAGYPGRDLNVPRDTAAVTYPAESPFLRVADHPDLWIAQPTVPLLLSQQGAFKRVLAQLGMYKIGQINGVVSSVYSVQKDDHFIDYRGAEWNVLNSNLSFSEAFRMLELEWLTGGT